METLGLELSVLGGKSGVDGILGDPVAPGSIGASSRASNKKQQLEFEMLFELVSISFISRYCSNMRFGLASIANVPTNCSKEKASMSRAHYS